MLYLPLLQLLQHVIVDNALVVNKSNIHQKSQLQTTISSQHHKIQHTPIEQVNVFKHAFPSDKNTGIYVSQFSDYGITGYAIDEFPENEDNRNHYTQRKQDTPIKYLIMHYTVGNFASTAQEFTVNKPLLGQVSSHIVITEEEEEKTPAGILISFVPENKIAYHAGVSSWQNDTNLNSMSIGIEHVNRGFNTVNAKKEWFCYDKHQIATSGIVSSGIIRRYNIKPIHVLGHSDIAYNRKSDPGPLFPWGQLYHEYNVGAWLTDAELNPQYIKEKYNPKISDPDKIDDITFLKLLQEYGYHIPDNVDLNKTDNPKQTVALCAPLILAFKAHFSANQHPELCDNAQITSTDKYWIWALTAKYQSQINQ
ncbi:N-acetylmuramoyl-L-alanine amidase [Orientia tsutsugamushi]|uniref:N-acetylmuramoyl-L-alanine amidase n=1 Tax=Orientia tsutsugamushi TaxID=784 RepID=UPI00315D7D69